MKREHVIEGTVSVKKGEWINVGVNLGTEDEQVLILTQEELMDLIAALTRFTKINYE